MSEIKTGSEYLGSEEGDSRIIHQFNPIPPDSRNITKRDYPMNSNEKIYRKIIGEETIIVPNRKRYIFSKITVLGITFMITNLSLGTAIFTFGVRAKSFGLVWFIIACILIGIINYWSIKRGIEASYRTSENDYSKLTEKILGKKAKLLLNILIILFSLACMMCFFSLIFSLFGRFIQNLIYDNKYTSYEDFEIRKWGKSYVKIPLFIGVSFCVSLLCLIKDFNKLNFAAYIGVASVIYTLFVVMIQCKDYYHYYKETKYNEEDVSTHPNWFNLENAFTKELNFFKGMATLFYAYSCHLEVFPIFNDLKEQPTKLYKMKKGVLFATFLTTVLHIISIVCSFLTDPYTPEDLIIYRKKKDSGKDLLMTISQLFVSLNLVFTIPEYYFGLRLSILNTSNKNKMSNTFNYIVTFSSCFFCGLIAAYYNHFLNLMSYIGGFISVFICYLFPILIYVKSSGKPVRYWKNLFELMLAIILCIIGVIAGILTIIDDFKK